MRRREEQPQHTGQLPERCEHGGQRGSLGGSLIRLELMLVDVLIDHANEVKQRSNGDRRVEIVIHGGQELGPQRHHVITCCGDCQIAFRTRAAGQIVNRRTADPLTTGEESAKSFQRAGALRKRLFTKVDRAAVVRGEQQHPNRFRFMPTEERLKRLSPG